MATNKKQHPNKKVQLIIEKADGEYWGRVTVKGNLIVDSADSESALKKALQKSILELEEVQVDEFDVSYDLTSFFDAYSYLNITDIAARVGINAALMRQYASGIKFPSEERVKEIEGAIRDIGKELTKVKLSSRKRELA